MLRIRLFYACSMMFSQIVELREQPEHPTEMEYVFYLVNVRQSSMGTVLNAAAAASSTADTPASSSSEAADTPKLYLEVSNVIEFDTFVITHGPGTFVDGKNSI